LRPPSSCALSDEEAANSLSSFLLTASALRQLGIIRLEYFVNICLAIKAGVSSIPVEVADWVAPG